MPKKFSKPTLSRQINGDLPLNNRHIATPSSPKIRLDQALSFTYPAYSRAVLKKFITAGRVTLDGAIAKKASQLISPDAEPKIHLPNTPTPALPPVLYEDADVLVLDKPAGLLSVSKGVADHEPSLESFGLVVHRLDRDTSGVIILAKNPRTKSYLQKQFQARTAHKSYYAITCGHPHPAAALINVPITRNLKRPTTFMVSKTGREAITAYRTLAENPRFSLLELKPQTGRTHQLRVHLAHLGTPILGDPIYNPNGPKAARLFLHAMSLEITLPSKKRLTFTAPLPANFCEQI